MPRFQSETGHRVIHIYEIYAGQKQRWMAGDFDVALFGSAQMKELAEQGKVVLIRHLASAEARAVFTVKGLEPSAA